MHDVESVSKRIDKQDLIIEEVRASNTEQLRLSASMDASLKAMREDIHQMRLEQKAQEDRRIRECDLRHKHVDDRLHQIEFGLGYIPASSRQNPHSGQRSSSSRPPDSGKESIELARAKTRQWLYSAIAASVVGIIAVALEIIRSWK